MCWLFSNFVFLAYILVFATVTVIWSTSIPLSYNYVAKFTPV